jgi:2-polyprenyl-3-methyl-5-hydroxy-6-metoxy-1,4-benzoquinol methylase
MRDRLATWLRRTADRLAPDPESREGRTEQVDLVFHELLERDLDNSGRRYFVELMDAGRSPAEIAVLVAKSDEYVNRVLRNSVQLPDLVEQAPERFVRSTPLDGDPPALLIRADGPEDYDWLERQIIENGFYERPGGWGMAPTDEKRIMRDIVAAFGPGPVLELGCANGVLIDLLGERGVDAEGIELSRMAAQRASAHARPRIHVGEIMEADLDRRFDVVVAFDILEHLNPNRLDRYLERIAAWVERDGFLVVNLPSFGPDDVFGDVFPLRFAEWQRAAAENRLFDVLELEEYGYPQHGHLVWATSRWWEDRFAAAGLRRVRAIETAIQDRYRATFDEIAPARATLYVLSRDGASRAGTVIGNLGGAS